MTARTPPRRGAGVRMGIIPARRIVAAVLLAPLLTVPCARGAAGEQAVIFDMDTVRHRPADVAGADQQKVPAGTAEAVAGKFAGAVKFSFAGGTSGAFMMGNVKATADWDRADGFSFWVKGDGSKSWGGLELIDRDDFGLRYG